LDGKGDGGVVQPRRLRELFPSKEALDAAGTGAADVTVETFAQLDQLLVTLGASVERPAQNARY
jgi:hypothetical protein